jgi:transcriptional regulator with XRE-family HTH domain
MNDIEVKARMASQLKRLRKQKKLTLDATAELTGVSKAMLGQIEREESSPTIATLWKISSGLETSYSSFFVSEASGIAEPAHFPDDPNMQVKTIFPFMADTGLEVFEIILLNGHKQLSEPHQHGVIEHVHVIKGRLSILSDGEWSLLEEGECTRIYADQDHGYHGIDDQVVFYNTIRYT